jgi:hypothetical protein
MAVKVERPKPVREPFALVISGSNDMETVCISGHKGAEYCVVEVGDDANSVVASVTISIEDLITAARTAGLLSGHKAKRTRGGKRG